MDRYSEERDAMEPFLGHDPSYAPEYMPKVRRFQKALKDMLNRQLDRINMDLKDKHILVMAENRAKQDIDEELYWVHEELVRLHTNLEDYHRTNARTALEGQQAQEELEAIRSEYRDKAGKADKERSHMSQLQAEIAQVMRHLSYMQEVNSEMCSDIGAMGNADRKAQAEKSQAEEHKYKQDLERITEQTDQIAARKRETQAATEALSEGEEDSYRKSITKEQERNEMLTVQLKRHQMEAATYSKLIGQSQAEQEALQAQYSTYGRTLYETQCSLAKLNVECAKYTRRLAGKMAALKKERPPRLSPPSRPCPGCCPCSCRRCKRLQALRDGSYVPLSTADTVEEALQRQTERAHSMSAILHRVCGESPEHQGALRGLIHTMAPFGQTVSRVQENPPPQGRGRHWRKKSGMGLVGGHKPSKIMKFVDKITKSKYFQKATETEFIKKKMEEVSNTPLLLTVEAQELRGTLAVNIPPPPTDRIW
ncbi:hypothetical protein NHX12_018716 [Muraenolepis orangiensis]|uniref:Uncharacterized protein n=1 Tax=Muraenolepis orangiensis TaxID=630683 RepID=A0A9Q0IYP1_9TELE|nr:hypothetical protein NHX12_018716 [Muraenolepis orangiensis]